MIAGICIGVLSTLAIEAVAALVIMCKSGVFRREEELEDE